MAVISNPSGREMRLAVIWTKAQSSPNRFFSERDPGGSVIDASKIEISVGACELTMGDQEVWVVGYSLLQKPDGVAGSLWRAAKS
jgi:hypothetical protein